MDCNARIRSDAMGRITVDPFHGLGRVVVLADVAHELSLQVGQGGEDPACDHIALDLGEPQLHLVEPGGVGRGVMQMDPGMLGEERIDAFGLVGREVVTDDMNLFAFRLVRNDVGQEGHELGAGVPWRGLAHDLAGPGVEGGIKGQGAVAVILESMTLDATRRKRQHRIEPVQGLNGGLLIDAEHRGMRRRVQVQADDIGGLGFEVRIVRGHIAEKPMGLQTMLGPNAGDPHVGEAERGGKSARAPVGRAVAGRFPRPGEDPGFEWGGVIGRRASAMPGVESAQPLGFEAALPAADVIWRARQMLTDGAPAQALIEHHEKPRTLHIGSGRSARAGQRLQHPALFRSETEDRVHASYVTTDINVTVH